MIPDNFHLLPQNLCVCMCTSSGIAPRLIISVTATGQFFGILVENSKHMKENLLDILLQFKQLANTDRSITR